MAHVPEILAALTAKAKEGDVAAAKLLLERVLPPLKATELPWQFPGFPVSGTLVEQGKAVIGSMAEGRVALDQGASLLGALTAQSRLLEITEIVQRLEALEARSERS